MEEPRQRVAPGITSLCSARPSFITCLVTQMYFPGDSLFPYDPVSQSIRCEKARTRVISNFDLETPSLSGPPAIVSTSSPRTRCYAV